MKTKTLWLEKRGCDFFKGDAVSDFSDCENYRLVGRIVDKYGRNLTLEFGRCDKRRTTNKRTGEPLKNGFIVEHSHKLHLQTYYENFNGSWGDSKLDALVYNKDFDYTQKDILKAVRLLTGRKVYDNIIIADTLPDLFDTSAHITKADREYLYKIANTSPDELEQKAGYKEKNIINHLSAWKKTNEGKTIELYSYVGFGCVLSCEWHIERHEFTG